MQIRYMAYLLFTGSSFYDELTPFNKYFLNLQCKTVEGPTNPHNIAGDYKRVQIACKSHVI